MPFEREGDRERERERENERYSRWRMHTHSLCRRGRHLIFGDCDNADLARAGVGVMWRGTEDWDWTWGLAMSEFRSRVRCRRAGVRAAAALIGLLHRSRKRCERRRLTETDEQWCVNVIVGCICLYVLERDICVCVCVCVREREVRTFMHYLSLYSMQHCCSWLVFGFCHAKFGWKLKLQGNVLEDLYSINSRPTCSAHFMS